MANLKLMALLLSLCLLAPGTLAQQPIKIQGVWQLLTQKVDGKASPPTNMLKTITKDRWSWINQDKEKMAALLAKKTKADSLSAFAEYFGAGYGTYTLSGDNYTEKVDFMSFTPFMGRSFTFKVKIEGDHLLQSGKMPSWGADGKVQEVLLEEEYKRLE